MAKINWGSIQAKAQAAMKSNAVKKRISDSVDSMVLGGGGSIPPLESAARKFIEVLRGEIQNSASSNASAGGLGPTAVSALEQLDHGSPNKIGDNLYEISISFTGDLTRESLDESRSDGVYNLAALLNSGYTAGHTVRGVWKGHSEDEIYSLVSRGGARFIERAISTFMANYAKEYGVIDITCDGVYK